MEGVAGVRDGRSLRTGVALGELERRLVGDRAAVGEEHRFEIARRDLRQVVRQRGRVLRHERDADLVALLVLELLRARGEDARVIVPVGHRAEAAEEIEDRPVVLVVVVHALGALDEHLVEAEQLEEVQLPGVQVALEQLAHLLARTAPSRPRQ